MTFIASAKETIKVELSRKIIFVAFVSRMLDINGYKAVIPSKNDMHSFQIVPYIELTNKILSIADIKRTKRGTST